MKRELQSSLRQLKCSEDAVAQKKFQNEPPERRVFAQFRKDVTGQPVTDPNPRSMYELGQRSISQHFPVYDAQQARAANLPAMVKAAQEKGDAVLAQDPECGVGPRADESMGLLKLMPRPHQCSKRHPDRSVPRVVPMGGDRAMLLAVLLRSRQRTGTQISHMSVLEAAILEVAALEAAALEAAALEAAASEAAALDVAALRSRSLQAAALELQPPRSSLELQLRAAASSPPQSVLPEHQQPQWWQSRQSAASAFGASAFQRAISMSSSDVCRTCSTQGGRSF